MGRLAGRRERSIPSPPLRVPGPLRLDSRWAACPSPTTLLGASKTHSLAPLPSLLNTSSSGWPLTQAPGMPYWGPSAHTSVSDPEASSFTLFACFLPDPTCYNLLPCTPKYDSNPKLSQRDGGGPGGWRLAQPSPWQQEEHAAMAIAAYRSHQNAASYSNGYFIVSHTCVGLEFKRGLSGQFRCFEWYQQGLLAGVRFGGWSSLQRSRQLYSRVGRAGLVGPSPP